MSSAPTIQNMSKPRSASSDRRRDEVVLVSSGMFSERCWFQSWLFGEIDADELVLATREQFAVGHSGIGADDEREDLYTTGGLEPVRRRRRHDELSLLGQHEQLVVHKCHCAGAHSAFAPTHLASLPLDAAEVAALLLPTVEAIEKTFAINARCIMIREHFILCPDYLGP